MSRITLLDTYKPTTARMPYPMRREVKSILNMAPIARHYEFDANASQRIGELMRDHLDLIIDNIEFARAPYPTTYIELDMRAIWRGWRPEQPQAPTMDNKIGYLIHNGTVVILAESDQDGSAITTWVVRINRTQAKSPQELFGKSHDASELIKQAYIFGGQRTHKAYHEWDFDEEQQGIIMPMLPNKWTYAQVAAHFDILPAFEGIPKPTLLGSAFLGGGDPIIVATALLLLNQPHSSNIEYHVIPKSSGLYKGKLKTYKEHSIVTIHLTPKQKLTDLFVHVERSSPIRHDVEGHWKNFNKHPNCSHDWEPVGIGRTEDGGVKNYWCPKCLQRRTWTESYVRGDGTKGLGTKEYVVKN